MNSSEITNQSSAIANSRAYLTDSLFRADHVVTVAPDTRDEAGRILSMALANNGLSDSDKSYLAQIVATTTGLAPADASKRVENVMSETKRQADEARKAGSLLSFMTGLSLLIGAFIAGAAAALGGLQRDQYR